MLKRRTIIQDDIFNKTQKFPKDKFDIYYIVFACAGFCEKDVADTNLMFEFILKKVYSATIMSLTGQGLSSVLNLYKEYANEGEKGNIASAYFKNNVVYVVIFNL